MQKEALCAHTLLGKLHTRHSRLGRGGAAPADRTLTPRVISLLRVSSAFGVIGARPHKDTHTQRVGGGASERERERDV